MAPASYVGSERCSICHAPAFDAWKGSHHRLAMQIPSETSVLGNFGGKVFRYFGEVTRFRRRDPTYEIETQGASRGGDSGRRSYEVKYTFGVEPLQQYLVDVGDGHLQALPFAYDTRPKERGGVRWYHLHPDEHVKPGDELHWAAPAYNWNKNCADCHSTNVRKNYERDADRYDTQFAEISVGCEACHGPGSRHVDQAERHAFGADRGWSRRFSKFGERTWQFARDLPIAQLASADRARGSVEVAACAPCHARRSDLGGDFSDFVDRFRVDLLEERSYFVDGQIRDEVFEYGSFVQSKMHAAGVVCSDCHDPHGGALRASGNALCDRCHSAAVFDTPRHHFHPSGSPGSECVQCHMPSRTYMGVDERRDHRFGLPRPDLSLEIGVPNACSPACHRSDAWAKEAIERHFGKERPKTFARALHAARNVRLGGADQLLGVAGDTSWPAIVRATALLELRAYPEVSAASLAPFARAPDPLLRRTLAQLVGGWSDPVRGRDLVVALLSDGVRSVRLEAVRALLEVPTDDWSEADRKAFERARGELRASLESNADRAEALVDLARLDAAGAEAWMKRALVLDPTFAAAYVNLADLFRSQGREGEAVELLKRGTDRVSDRASVEHALGLALVRSGDKRTALGHLQRAHELAPNAVTFGYVYAVALYDSGKTKEAVALLERLHQRFDGDLRVQATLAQYAAQAPRATK